MARLAQQNVKDETYMSNRVTVSNSSISVRYWKRSRFQLLKSIKSKEHNVECRIISILYLIVITSYVYKYIIYDKGQWS